MFLLFSVLVGWAYARPYRFILSSTADGSGSIVVDDDLKVTLLRQDGSSLTIINDSDKQKTSISPVFFYAEKGDRLLIEAVDIGREGGKKFLSPIYLTNRDTGEVQLIVALFPETPSAREGEETFLHVEYTIGEPLKEYCISSVPDGCSEIYVDDDVPEVSINYGDTYKLEAKLSTDKTASLLSMRLMLPADPASSYLIVKDTVFRMKFTNYRGKGYVSRVFLVPVDNQGPVISVLESPLEIEGNCKENCPENIIYDFNSSLAYILPPIDQDSRLYFNLKQVSEGGRNGIKFDIEAFPDFASPLAFYWKTSYGNLFLTDKGYSTHPQWWTLKGRASGVLWMPKYSAWQRLLVDGNYTIGAIVKDDESIKRIFTFALKPTDPEMLSVNGSSMVYNDTEVATAPVTTLEDYILSSVVTALGPKKSEDADIDFIQMLLGISPNPFVRSHCVKISSEENSTIDYCFNILNSGDVHNGLIVKYNPDGTTDVIFIELVYCKKRIMERINSDNQTSNQIGNIIPSNQFVTREEPCSPNTSLVNPIVSVSIPETNYYGKLRLNRTLSFNSTLVSGPFSKGTIFYNYYKLPILNTTLNIDYKFTYDINQEHFESASYNYAIEPPRYRVVSLDDYPNGVKIEREVTDMGYPTLKLNFKFKVEAFREDSSNFSDVSAIICLDRSNIENSVVSWEYITDQCFVMNRSENTYSFTYYVPGSESNHIDLYYWFWVIDEGKRIVPGELVLRKHHLSYFNTSKVAITVIGADAYSLGESVDFKVKLRTPFEDRNKSYQVYVGVDKKGRGVVWLYDYVPNAFILKTSYDRKPLLTLNASSCLGECDARIVIPTEKNDAFFSPMFVGDYTLIIEIEDKDTQEVVGKIMYPFTISPQ